MMALNNQSTLEEAIQGQVAYYFSEENLRRDPFTVQSFDVHRLMDLKVLVAYARLARITNEKAHIEQALKNSPVFRVVYDDSGECLVGPSAEVLSGATCVVITAMEDTQDLEWIDQLQISGAYGGVRPLVQQIYKTGENVMLVVTFADRPGAERLLQQVVATGLQGTSGICWLADRFINQNVTPVGQPRRVQPRVQPRVQRRISTTHNRSRTLNRAAARRRIGRNQGANAAAANVVAESPVEFELIEQEFPALRGAANNVNVGNNDLNNNDPNNNYPNNERTSV